MKLTLRFPREKGMLYAAWFLTPLAVRSVPELLTRYPIGFDTPFYMYAAKVYAEELPRFAWNIKADPGWYQWYGWRPFLQMLGLVYWSGVDMVLFMKVFPTVVYAASIFVLSLYLFKRLGWGPYSTLIVCVLLSVSPAMLRMSWDLHRENFALFIFLVSLFFVDPLRGKRNMAIMIPLSLLTGMVHECAIGILEVVLLYNAVLSAVKRDRGAFVYYALLALIPIAAYLLLRLLFPTSKPLLPLFARQFSWGRLIRFEYEGDAWVWMNLNWWLSLLILAYGLIIPLSALGAFNHRHFTPWTTLTLTAYASVVITPFLSLNLPDRWLFLGAPPITVYAANALVKFRKNWKVAVAIALVSVQAMSMLGLFSKPLFLYAGQHYGVFADTLLVSTTDEQTVDAIREVAAWLNANTPVDAVIGAPYDLYGWALYFTDGRTFVRCDTPELALAYLGRYPSSYFVWHTGAISQQYKPVYQYYPVTVYQRV